MITWFILFWKRKHCCSREQKGVLISQNNSHQLNVSIRFQEVSMPPHMTSRGEYMAYTRAYPRNTSSTALGNTIVNQTWSKKSLRDSEWYQAGLFSIHDSVKRSYRFAYGCCQIQWCHTRQVFVIIDERSVNYSELNVQFHWNIVQHHNKVSGFIKPDYGYFTVRVSVAFCCFENHSGCFINNQSFLSATYTKTSGQLNIKIVQCTLYNIKIEIRKGYNWSVLNPVVGLLLLASHYSSVFVSFPIFDGCSEMLEQILPVGLRDLSVGLETFA